MSARAFVDTNVNVRRKAARPLSGRDARNLVRDYLAWEVAANAAALERLYSQDLSHGQRYGGVEVVNPLAS